MVTKLFVVFSFLVTSSGSADTLGSLADSCAEEDIYSMGYCTGYLGAVVDSLGYPRDTPHKQYGICFGKLTNQLLFDAVTEGVARHPELKTVDATRALIKVFQESFPCDETKRKALKDAKTEELRTEFLTKCVQLPLSPRKGGKADACKCTIDKIAKKVDLTTGDHYVNVDILFSASAKELEEEIARYPEWLGFNKLMLDRIYMKALATCF